MAILRRRNVHCFYCGQQSKPPPNTTTHPNKRIKYFTCPQCNADNHLDERGDIVDYVPSPRASQPRFIFGREPTTVRPPSPTFCKQCQTNQRIIANAVSDYEIPPEDHPDYNYVVTVKFPAFEKELHAKWPPVCANCAPKVSQKIKQSNYIAKASSLGHMLARTDKEMKKTPPPPFDPKRVIRRLVWWVRGVVWVASHVLFLAWHGMEALYPSAYEGMEAPSWGLCLQRTVEQRWPDVACRDMIGVAVNKYALWTLVGFFWIYRERGLDHHPEKTLVGGREYLNLEIAVTAIRLLSWLILASGGVSLKEAAQRIHIVLFFLSLVAALFLITCLKLVDPPQFSLRENKLDSPVEFTPRRTTTSTYQPTFSPQQPPPLLPQPRQPSPQKRAFPTQPTTPPRLAPMHSSQPIPVFTPGYRDRGLTMSPDTERRHGYDSDAMDWTTTSPTPLPKPTLSTSNTPTWRSNPSPFAQTNNPTVSTGFSAFTPSAQQNLFARPPPALSASSTPTFAHQTTPNFRLSDPRFAPLPTPKFIPQPPADDTGLESLFGGRLVLKDDDEDDSTPVESESLTSALLRLALLGISGTVLAIAPSALTSAWHLHAVAMLGVLIAALWRGDRTSLPFALVAVAAAGVGELVPCANVPEKLVLAGAGAVEAWMVINRWERTRKRTFWREERRRRMESEVREQRERGVGGGGGGGDGLMGMGSFGL